MNIEIRAAEIEQIDDHIQPDEIGGMSDHASATDLVGSSREREAGWLAREMITHYDRVARDANAWPWDITRPVAGQYEEWLIAEQGRHDVAASVARHAEIEESQPFVSWPPNTGTP